MIGIFLGFLIKSKILERYFLWETIKPFLLCLFVITFIMMLDRLMDLMNLILEKQLDIITIINLFALSFPFIFALSVPMAVLTSTIMAFGRMSVDKELTATKSTGINVLRMTGLLMIFMMIIAVGMAYFNDYILPETNHLLKNVLIKVSYRKPITAIKPGTFTTMNNLTIFARERTDEALYDLLIFNLENVRFPQTIFARRGEIYLDPQTDRLQVILYDGEMHERDVAEAEQYQIGTFQRYTLFLENMGFGEDDTSTDYRGDREMTSLQMRALYNERKQDVENLNNEIANFQKILDELQSGEGELPTEEISERVLGDDFHRLLIQDSLDNAEALPLVHNIQEMGEETESQNKGEIAHLGWYEGMDNVEFHLGRNVTQQSSIGSRRSQTTPPRNRNEEIRRYTVMINLRQSQKSEIERQMRRYQVEMHKKYSLGAACFVMMLVGVAIGIMTKTSGLGVSFSFSSLIFVIYYIFLVMGEEFGNKGTINPIFSMWFPSLFFFFVGLFLLYIAKREKRFDVMMIWIWIKTFYSKKIKNKFKRKKKELIR
ncbi:MAG: LptF/LptG family permease [Candidatus Cloacimonetes bacterium]|nr:LptF/LptG family permease [Candidatus Cloacimonadota bacterium]